MLGILIIVTFLGLILAIIRFSPLRGRLERFDRERPKRDARAVDEVRLHPLTFVLTLLFACVCAFGLIYIFAFSDNGEDRWQHLYVVLPVAALVGTGLAFARKREGQGPLSIKVRRFIWGSILISYALAFLLILRLGLSPFSRFSDTLRLFCYLGSLAPLAFAAWSLIHDSGKGASRSTQPTPPSQHG